MTIMNRLSDKLNPPDIMKSESPALLIDPSYHANVGDTLISYGELILIERSGFLNHTECGILQSIGVNQKCGTFSQFPNGGLAFWNGKKKIVTLIDFD